MKKNVLIFIIIILLVVIGFLVLENLKVNSNNSEFSVDDNLEQKYKNSSVDENVNDIQKEDSHTSDISENNFCLAYIMGSIFYPSENIPDNMYVCARNTKTDYEYCTDKTIYDKEFKYKKGYKLEVPAGKYLVAGMYPWAMSNKNMQEFKYKNNFIQVSCNQTVRNIDLLTYGAFDFFKRFDLTKYNK